MGTLRARSMTNAQLRREIVTVARRAATNINLDATARNAIRELADGHPPEELARLLHSYIVNRTEYRAENRTQRVRYPAAFVRQRIGDCKSTAIFLASMLHAAGVPVLLRFVQTPGRPWYGHVYAVALGIGPVDPLLPFGSEVSYLRREDYTL